MPKSRKTTSPIQKAFSALNRQGILTAHAFGCCGKCGAGELRQHIPREGRGFVFYSGEDCEEAMVTGKVKVRFEADDGLHLSIASRCIVSLEKSGLQTKWDADCSKPILVTLTAADKELFKGFCDRADDRLLAATGDEHKKRDVFKAWRRLVNEQNKVQL